MHNALGSDDPIRVAHHSTAVSPGATPTPRAAAAAPLDLPTMRPVGSMGFAHSRLGGDRKSVV